MKTFDEFKSWATREMSFAINFHEMREIYDFFQSPRVEDGQIPLRDIRDVLLNAASTVLQIQGEGRSKALLVRGYVTRAIAMIDGKDPFG